MPSEQAAGSGHFSGRVPRAGSPDRFSGQEVLGAGSQDSPAQRDDTTPGQPGGNSFVSIYFLSILPSRRQAMFCCAGAPGLWPENPSPAGFRFGNVFVNSLKLHTLIKTDARRQREGIYIILRSNIYTPKSGRLPEQHASLPACPEHDVPAFPTRPGVRPPRSSRPQPEQAMPEQATPEPATPEPATSAQTMSTQVASEPVLPALANPEPIMPALSLPAPTLSAPAMPRHGLHTCGQRLSARPGTHRAWPCPGRAHRLQGGSACLPL